MNLNDFLIWLGTGGSIMAVSFILERIDAFQKLESKAKEIVMFIASGLLATGATAFLQFVPAETVSLIAPYFSSLAAVFGILFLAKTFHKVDKKPTIPIDNSQG